MAFFKRKTKEPEKEEERGIPEIAEPKAVSQKPTAASKKKKKEDVSLPVLSSPHVTEKATLLMEKGSYIFKVFDQSTKGQIKQAVEGMYGVDVNRVNIIRIPEKKIRVGRRQGIKKGYKKAIVTVKAGQEIELLPR